MKLPLALLSLAALASRALACPTCKDALGEDPAQRGFSVGIGVTVLGMLTIVFGLASLLVLKAIREDRAKAQASQG